MTLKVQQRFIDNGFPGKKFGRYTVLYIHSIRDRRQYWMCKCDCGTERSIYRGNLLKGKSTSCGCGGRQHDPLESAIKSIECQYRHRSKIKNIEYKLTLEQFRGLITGTCYYCGISGGCKYKDPSLHHSSEWRSKKQIEYTGIDRLNPTEGYTELNSVSCCLVCNKAKNTMTKDEFLAWIDRVYTFTKDKGKK